MAKACTGSRKATGFKPLLDLHVKILLIFYAIIQSYQFPQLHGKYYKNLDYLGNNKFVFTKRIELFE